MIDDVEVSAISMKKEFDLCGVDSDRVYVSITLDGDASAVNQLMSVIEKARMLPEVYVK